MTVDHRAIVDATRKYFAVHYGRDAEEVPGACLYWAASVIHVAARAPWHLNLVMQAGSAMFQRLPEHLDDGKPDTLTHFSYVWTPPDKDPLRAPHINGVPVPPWFTTRPDPRNDGKIRACLPEIHVWAGDPATQTLVDLTTFKLAAQCVNIMGAPWFEAPPPDYLWHHVAELPNGWRYEPIAAATFYAMKMARLLT